MNEKTREELQKENDLLIRLAKSANKQADESERVIKLLIAIGIVDQDKIDKVREIAQWKSN